MAAKGGKPPYNPLLTLRGGLQVLYHGPEWKSSGMGELK